MSKAEALTPASSRSELMGADESMVIDEPIAADELTGKDESMDMGADEIIAMSELIGMDAEELIGADISYIYETNQATGKRRILLPQTVIEAVRDLNTNKSLNCILSKVDQDASLLHVEVDTLRSAVDTLRKTTDTLRKTTDTLQHDTATALSQSNRIYTGVDLSEVHMSEIATHPNVWEWIRARIRAGNYEGINVGDWIPLSVAGHTFHMEIAGIDTYRPVDVRHHIDLISRELWPEPVSWNLANYNNGTAEVRFQWLASNAHAYLNSLQMDVPNGVTANPPMRNVDYRNGGILSRLPVELRNVISTKGVVLSARQLTGMLLTEDNWWLGQTLGKLWLPSEVEVCGASFFGHAFSSSPFVQYPLFANTMRRRKTTVGGQNRLIYWTLTVAKGTTTEAVTVSTNGHSIARGTLPLETTPVFVPICFRIA